MNQAVTLNIRLNPSDEELQLLKSSSLAYIQTINSLVSEMVENQSPTKKTSKDIVAPLNSAVKNQAIRDAKSVFQKARKTKFSIVPVLKKPVVIWNNQNFSVTRAHISMPFIVEGRSRKLSVSAHVQERDIELLAQSVKVGTLRVTRKGTKWMAQIAIELPTEKDTSAKAMGVDLGIKVPAVCVTEENEVKFCGNGRMNKYVRRYHNSHRKKLGKLKKLNAIRKSQNKEQRWMKDQDHKISRSIINFAVEHKVGVIRLEQLAKIRQQTRKSRKNNHSLSNWSFYRLAQCIEYKAKLVGIKVEYVNPAYTSQHCPKCGQTHHATDRRYACSDCGYSGHRDLVGAKNIISAPVLDGNSQVA